jgi:hypothetical protein
MDEQQLQMENDIIPMVTNHLKENDGFSHLPNELQLEPAPEQKKADVEPKENRSERLSRKARYDQQRLAQAFEREQNANARAYYSEQVTPLLYQKTQNLEAMLQQQIDQNLELKELSAMKLLEDAKMEGNTEVEVKAINLIAQINAEKVSEQQRRHMEQFSAPYAQPQFNMPPYAQPQQNMPYTPQPANYYPPVEQPANPHFDEWLDKNPWCDPNSKQFDTELAAEAAIISRQIEKNYTIRGEKEKIGTPQFINEVSKILENKYSNKPSYPPNYYPTNVGPVNRHNSPISFDNDGVPTTVELTPEEKKFALDWDYDGNPSEAERYRRYARDKIAVMQRRRAAGNY